MENFLYNPRDFLDRISNLWINECFLVFYAQRAGDSNKLGGGTKKLLDRFHAYHVFRAYDNALSDDAGLTFEHVLGHISTVYESKQSKVSQPETRIENLKRTFRQSRPVLHLTWGIVDSFQSKG